MPPPSVVACLTLKLLVVLHCRFLVAVSIRVDTELISRCRKVNIRFVMIA